MSPLTSLSCRSKKNIFLSPPKAVHCDACKPWRTPRPSRKLRTKVFFFESVGPLRTFRAELSTLPLRTFADSSLFHSVHSICCVMEATLELRVAAQKRCTAQSSHIKFTQCLRVSLGAKLGAHGRAKRGENGGTLCIILRPIDCAHRPEWYYRRLTGLLRPSLGLGKGPLDLDPGSTNMPNGVKNVMIFPSMERE